MLGRESPKRKTKNKKQQDYPAKGAQETPCASKKKKRQAGGIKTGVILTYIRFLREKIQILIVNHNMLYIYLGMF